MRLNVGEGALAWDGELSQDLLDMLLEERFDVNTAPAAGIVEKAGDLDFRLSTHYVEDLPEELQLTALSARDFENFWVAERRGLVLDTVLGQGVAVFLTAPLVLVILVNLEELAEALAELLAALFALEELLGVELLRSLVRDLVLGGF